MASPSQNRTPRLYHAVDALPAVAIFLGAVATFLGLGIAIGGTLGLVVAQIVGLAAVPVVAAQRLTGGFAALGLALPRPGAVAGAVLVGASFWYINLRLSLPVAEWLDGRDELRAFQDRYIASEPLVPTLVILALVPGVCEELLCRGLLVRSLAARLPAAVAVAVSAAAFSLLHLSPARALPTFTLGLVLGAVALATRSVWPAVVIHVVNNVFAVAVAQGALGPLAAAIGGSPDLALVICAGITIGGLVLAIPAQRNQHDMSP
jgi:membrane protease YdiL (CAAX protease family)